MSDQIRKTLDLAEKADRTEDISSVTRITINETAVAGGKEESVKFIRIYRRSWDTRHFRQIQDLLEKLPRPLEVEYVNADFFSFQ
ncbi:MAG TPA: hypothetical protein VMR73_00275 [Candidatus Paceibacterota bacterium]|nr:hypothetical protein [Candidatus Paceibacterota bacterium]